jgi:transposase
LFSAVFVRAHKLNLIDERPQGAVDATGLEARYASSYYVDRKGYRPFGRRRWPKLTAVCHTGSYLFPGAWVTWGPSNDSPQFAPAVTQAARRIDFDRILADAAYDGEHNHRLCREELGIRSTVIPLNPRRGSNPLPKTKYRRQMKTRFPKRIYGQRWHVESAFSQTKRILGQALRARRPHAQEREVLLRVLTHNLMILAFYHLIMYAFS